MIATFTLIGFSIVIINPETIADNDHFTSGEMKTCVCVCLGVCVYFISSSDKHCQRVMEIFIPSSRFGGMQNINQGWGWGWRCSPPSSRITWGIIPPGLSDDRMLQRAPFDQPSLGDRDYQELFTQLPR